MRAGGFQFIGSYKYLTSRMRKFQWFTLFQTQTHTHRQCLQLFISMKIGRLMWVTMRTSHLISVRSREITLCVCFFGYIVYSDAEWPHDWVNSPAAVLAQPCCYQGAVRAAEHWLWKDTRKPAVAMLLGFEMLQWRWYLMIVLDSSFWRWGYWMMYFPSLKPTSQDPLVSLRFHSPIHCPFRWLRFRDRHGQVPKGDETQGLLAENEVTWNPKYSYIRYWMVWWPHSFPEGFISYALYSHFVWICRYKLKETRW